MQPQTLDARVERLEKRVTILEHLPARVEELAGQILQLREEMHAEFSAVRGEIRGAVKGLATESQMRMMHEEVLSRFALIHEGRPGRRKQR